jgi:hypothetical protein
MATTTKSARLTEEEVAFLHKLLPHYPEYRSESQFLHTATMLGLWLLAVGARRPGLEPFGGYEADDLAALLQPRILAAIDFLAEQGRLPTLLQISQALAAGVVPAASVPVAGDEQAIDPQVADDMADLGTEFMDD